MKIYDSYNEARLIVNLKNGDINAFNELFAIYSPRLLSFTNGYLKSREESEEVVQEVFVILWRKRKDLNPGLSFKSYLFKIAYHLILEAFNRISKREEYKHEMLKQSFSVSDNLDERLDYQMLLQKVEKVIEQLPPRQREIFILRKKEGIAVKEIAERLKISSKTVENQLTKAIKRIKSTLGPDDFAILLFFHLFLSL